MHAREIRNVAGEVRSGDTRPQRGVDHDVATGSTWRHGSAPLAAYCRRFARSGRDRWPSLTSDVASNVVWRTQQIDRLCGGSGEGSVRDLWTPGPSHCSLGRFH